MNIVLIGMPGCGKSTVGVLLAKSMLMGFVDTDLIIQQEYKQTLCEIIEKVGIEQFKKIENDVICSKSYDNYVIATGGSAVYGDKAMNKLCMSGKIVYLKTTPAEIVKRIDNIKTRGIAMHKDCTIEKLYNERSPLYDKYADFVVDCTNLTAEQCVNRISDFLKNVMGD